MVTTTLRYPQCIRLLSFLSPRRSLLWPGHLSRVETQHSIASCALARASAIRDIPRESRVNLARAVSSLSLLLAHLVLATASVRQIVIAFDTQQDKRQDARTTLSRARDIDTTQSIEFVVKQINARNGQANENIYHSNARLPLSLCLYLGLALGSGRRGEKGGKG